MKYKLGDLTIKNWNDWDQVPRMPEVIAGAIIAGLGGSAAIGATATFLITAASYLAVSAVTSWAINALTPKPDLGSLSSSGILVNTRNPASPADFVYGKVRKGGIVTYYESTDDNKYLHQIIVVAAHEVNAITDIYINDKTVTIEADTGLVTSSDWCDEDDNSKIRIYWHVGDQFNPTDTFANSSYATMLNTLISESETTGDDKLDVRFLGRGLAFIYVRYEYDQDVFANGLPLITAVIEGKKVYDPRTSTTAYSNNAALCVMDFLTSEYGLNDDAIDEIAFSAAANECDENVPVAAGGTEKRYTINGIVRADRAVGDVLGDMMASCAGTLFWGSGNWKLKVGTYSAPVKTLTMDDLRSPISLDTRVSIRDNFNQVQGTFNNAEEDWITTDYPKIVAKTYAGSFVVGKPYTILEVGSTDFTLIGASSNTVGVTFTATGVGSGTGYASLFIGEDNGEEIALDMQLPYTTSSSTAQRLAKLTLFRGREQMTITAEFGMNAMDIEVGDIIAFTNDRYGWDEKEFEVTGWKLSANQDAGDLRIGLTLRETSSEAFDWDAEEIEIVSNNTNLPSTTAGLDIAGLSATSSGGLQTDGTFINTAILTWTAASNAYVDRYEVQWRKTTDSAYATTFTTNTTIELSPIIVGDQYTFRVRAVNSNGFRGAYASTTLTGAGDSSIPKAPTITSISGGYRTITLDWDQPTQNTDDSPIKDLRYYKVYRGLSANPTTEIGITYASIFTDGGLSDSTTYHYRISAVDQSGNVSEYSANASVATNAPPADGERGPGRWHVPVSSLPTTSSAANTAFLTLGIGSPVEDDQAWFYTGTLSNPTGQVVWIFQSSTWVKQDEVVDGNLLVTGTLTTAKIAGNAISQVTSGFISSYGGQISNASQSASNLSAYTKRIDGSFIEYNSPASISEWATDFGSVSYTIPSDGYSNEIISVPNLGASFYGTNDSRFQCAILVTNSAATSVYGWLPLLGSPNTLLANPPLEVLNDYRIYGPHHVIGANTFTLRLADYIAAGTSVKFVLGIWISGTSSSDQIHLYSTSTSSSIIGMRVSQLRR